MFELLFKTTVLLILELEISEDSPIHTIMEEISIRYDNDDIFEAENMLKDVSSRIIGILESTRDI